MTKQGNPRHDFIRTNGVRLHCAMQGPEEQPGRGTIVMLHGFPEFWFCWKEQIPEFARDFRVVAPDMRGYNLSDKPEGVEQYKMRMLVEDLLGLIDALGEEKVILMAHDWGGAVAWAFAGYHADRLDKLIILNAPHPTTFARELARSPDQQQSSQYIHLLRSDRAEEILLREDCKLLRKFMFGSMLRPDVLTEEEKAEYVKAWRQPGAMTGSTNFYRAMPAAPPDLAKGEEGKAKEDETSEPRAFMIHVPTLVVWGMKDFALLPGLLDGLERYVPQLKIHRIPEATHWVTHDAPDEVNRAVREYLG